NALRSLVVTMPNNSYAATLVAAAVRSQNPIGGTTYSSARIPGTKTTETRNLARRVDTSDRHDFRGRLAYLAETALTVLIARDGGVEIFGAELGPQLLAEHQLRIREPIEEEVRDALLATGADDELGIAHGQRRHAEAERIGRDVVCFDLAAQD